MKEAKHGVIRARVLKTFEDEMELIAQIQKKDLSELVREACEEYKMRFFAQRGALISPNASK